MQLLSCTVLERGIDIWHSDVWSKGYVGKRLGTSELMGDKSPSTRGQDHICLCNFRDHLCMSGTEEGFERQLMFYEVSSQIRSTSSQWFVVLGGLWKYKCCCCYAGVDIRRRTCSTPRRKTFRWRDCGSSDSCRWLIRHEPPFQTPSLSAAPPASRSVYQQWSFTGWPLGWPRILAYT